MSVLAASFFLLSLGLRASGGTAAPAARPSSEDAPRVVFSLEEAAGGGPGPFVLVFFSLDCPVCWEELLEARYLRLKYSIPIEIIGISAEEPGELVPFLDKHGFFSPVVSDRRRDLYRRFGVRLEPFVVVVAGDHVLYRDDDADDLATRREKLKRCLLATKSGRPS